MKIKHYITQNPFVLCNSLAVTLFIIAFFATPDLNAQTPTYYKVGTGTTGNTIPMGQASQKTQLLYPPGSFNTTPISGNITKIYFRNSASAITSIYTDFKVLFIQNTDLAFPATSYYTGLTIALNEPSLTLTGNVTAPGWFEINLTTPYLYDNSKSLVVEIQYSARSGATFSTTTTTSTGFNRRCSGTSLIATTGTTNTTWNDFGMDIIPAGGCTAPPTPGASTAIPSSGLCLGNNIALSLSGNSTGSGQTYQWQSSANVGGPYTNVGGSLITPSLNTSATSTLYYRCEVTCTGNSQYSTPVLVTVTPPFPAGTYTINSALGTGGGNFQTFAHAVNALNCGIAGPVVFNVVSGSGPYTEQVIIPPVSGASSTNTVTFNGNGAILQFGPTVSTARAVLILNGADYIIVNNLDIRATAATYGWGIHFLSQADNNTISNCQIRVDSTSTSTTNFFGIVMSSSTSTATTAGNSGNFNTITGNTISGGYNTMILTGSSTAGAENLNNTVSNNFIKNSYSNAFELLGQKNAIVSGNDISRPTRTNSTTTAGVYLSTGCSNALIEKNRIHNFFDAFSTGTSTCYCFYVSSDGTAAAPNKIINNLIYNMNGNGAYYGIYNTTGPYMQAYHNTIVFADQATTTGAAYGLYQTGATTGIDYRNNVIYITRSGTGIKRCIYFVSTTTGNTSNNNDLYLNAIGGTNNHVGQYVSTNYTTLTGVGGWQTANSNAWDQASIDNDPVFASPGTVDYTPQSSAVNDKGVGVGVTTDILNNSRSVSTPDPGAYEYSLLGTDAEITWVAPVGPFTTGLKNIVVNITNQQAQPISSVNLSYNDGTTIQTENFTGLSIAPSTSQQLTFAVQYNLTSIVKMRAYINNVNGGVDAFQGNDTTGYQFLCLPMSGAYTINSASPTIGGNFQSFNDAVQSMLCAGITGAVTFNVTAGSGPYNEQVIISAIPGVSSTNTVTFNGNGRTLSYTSSNSNERANIRLNGADYITFNNLVITAGGSTATEYGYGVQMNNDADHNTISGCTITTTSTPVTAASLNFAGVVINTGPVAVTTGNCLCDNNTISGCTISGGYYGIVMVANGATNTISGNQVLNNIVRDFYQYGIYLNGNDGALVEGNSISRPNRSSVLTFRGITLSGVSINTVVNKNKLFNPFGNAASSAEAGFCIYLTTCNATAGSENIISNNLIYGHIGSNGNHNGILHSNSNYTKYYHNTIVLNDVAATCTACAARGFYQAGTTVTGVEFVNNIITVSQGGTSTKQCIFFEAPSIAGVVLNGNNYLMSSTSGAQNETGRIGGNATNTATGTGYLTVFDWQTGTGQEANSVSVNPFFVNPGAGNYKPQVIQGDNIGVPVGILTDITGSARSVITPDAGAYEYTGTINDFCTGTPVAGTASGSNSLCNNQSATLTVTGYTNLVGITLQWKQSSTPGGPYINVTGGSGATTANYTTALLSANTYYVCEVSCSGGSSAQTNEVQLIITSPSILTTTPDTRCGLGTVNLSATGTSSNITWYNQSTGGTLLSTGNNYSPFVNTTSTFYAAASEPIVPSPVVTGFSGNLLGTVAGHTVGGNMFNVTAINEIKINSFDIHLQLDNSKGPSDITVYYKVGTYSGFTTTPGAWTLLGSTTGIVSAGVGVPTPLPIPINLTIPAGQTYGFYIVVTNLDVANPLRYNTSATSPTELAVAASDFNMQIIAGTAIFGPFTTGVATPAKRLWNGRVNYTYNCEGPRTAVLATVNPAPTILVSSTFPAVCISGSTDLTVSSGNDPDYDYTWTSSPAGFTAIGAGPHTVSPTVTTKYYVLATDNSSGANQGCAYYDSVTVTAGGTLASGTVSANIAEHCVSGASTLSLTGASGGFIQWQKSTVSAGGPWNNVGAGITSLSTGTLTQTAYYQAVVSCQTSSLTSNVQTITVNNPQISGSSGATRCGPGQVTLSATPSSGTVNWYSTPSGGTSLSSGNTYSPTVTGTATYYASASSGGGGAASLGLPNRVGSTTNTGYSDVGLMFTATQAFTLQSVAIYPVATTPSGNVTVTIALKNSSGAVLQSATVAVPTAVSPGVKRTVPLNFLVPVGTNHRLVFTSASGGGLTGMIREITTGFTYPYTLSGIASITSAYTGGASASYYYYFYDWQVVTGCEGMRVPVVATVNPSPNITASTSHPTICSGQSATLTATSTNPGYTYTWTPGPLTGASVNVTPSVNTTYTLNAIDISGGTYDQCAAIATITVNANAGLPPNPSASSNAPICEGNPLGLSSSNNASGQTTGNSYAWTGPGFTSGQQNPSVTGAATPSQSGTYTVTITNSFGCTNSANTIVSVNANPEGTAAVTGVSCVGLCDGGVVITPTAGLAPYIFTDGVSVNTDGIFANAFCEGPASVDVFDDNGCTANIPFSVGHISSAPVTLNVAFPTVPAYACSGNSIAATTNAVNLATTYTWDGPAGTTFNSTGNPYSSSSTSVTVNYGAPNGSGYNICVQAGNGCGSTNRRCSFVRGTVNVPGVITPANNRTTECASTSAGYSIAAVGGATGYTWSMTGNATVVGSGTSATVNFGAGWTGGTLSVTANTPCYSSAPRSLALSNATATPGAISGSATACPGSGVTYSVPVATGAATYNWVLPANTTGSSSSNSILVNFLTGFSFGDIKVSITSICGITSIQKIKTVASGLPAVPASISGNLSGLCGQTVVYSCPSVSGASSYTWTTPGTINSGQGSTSINASFASFVSGNVCVTANNSCGSGAPRCVPVAGKPTAPPVITYSPNPICANQSGVDLQVAPVFGTTGYVWTFPAGVTPVLDLGNEQIVNWGATGGVVTVTVNNACGNSTKNQTVVFGCREIAPETEVTMSEVMVYPNPAHDRITVQFTATEKTGYVLNLLDLSGRVISTANATAQKGINTSEMDLSTLAKGVYMIEVKSDLLNKQIRIVIE